MSNPCLIQDIDFELRTKHVLTAVSNARSIYLHAERCHLFQFRLSTRTQILEQAYCVRIKKDFTLFNLACSHADTKADMTEFPVNSSNPTYAML